MPQTQVRQKWNDETQAAGPNSPGSPRVQRVFAVLLLAMLLTALGLYLRRDPPAATRFATIRVAGYRSLTIMPVPFLRPDIESLHQTLNAMPTGLITVTPLAELESDDQLDQIRSGLASAVQRENDRLIVYVKAHGISELDETGQLRARLLCGDSYHPGLNSGRVDIGEVLSAVSAIRSPLKLVILDCNHIASDVRLGMAANEFPRLTSELLADLQDQQMWVMLAGGTLQVSSSDYAQQRTPFAHSVSQALSGEADRNSNGGNGNRQVELREFYSYVLKHGGGDGHVPILLRGGHDGSIAPDGVPHREVLVSHVPAARATAESVEVAGGTPAQHDPVSPSDTSAVPAAIDTGPDTDAELNSDAMPANDAADPIVLTGDPLLDATWLTLRGLLQTPALGTSENDVRLSPIALVPQRLRRLEERLVEFDVRRRTGGLFSSSSLDLQGLADSLDELGLVYESETIPELTDFQTNVREAWRRTQGIEAKQRVLRQVTQAWNVLLTTVYRLPVYVAWHDRVSVTSRTKHSSFDAIANLIASIQELRAELFQLDTGVMLDPVQMNPLEVAGFHVWQARDIVDKRILKSLHVAGPREIEAALATAIPDPYQRVAAEARLVELFRAASSPDADAVRRLSDSPLDGTAWQRNRAWDRLRLHALLLSLADNADSLLKPAIDLDQLQTRLTPDLAADPTIAFQQLRELGGIVRAAYRTLPVQLAHTDAAELQKPTEVPIGPRVEALSEQAEGLKAEADLVASESNHLHARRLYLDAADIWREAGLIGQAVEALDNAEQQQNQLPEIWREKLRDHFASIEDTITGARDELATEKESLQSRREMLREYCKTPAGQTARFTLAALVLPSSIDQLSSSNPALTQLRPPLRLPHFRIPTRIEIAARPPAVPLVLHQRVQVNFVLTRTGDQEPHSSTRVLFRFTNPFQDVEVRRHMAEGESPLLKSGDVVDVNFDDSDQAEIKLLLTATEFASPSDSTRQTVRIHAEIDGSSSPSFAVCDGRLPASDMVALSVTAVDVLPPGVQSSAHALRLFPNRTTHYGLSLVNQTLIQRFVRVRLFKAARPAEADWARGLLYSADPFLNPNPGLFEGLAAGLERSRQIELPLAESSELELPSDGSPVPIAFKDVSPVAASTPATSVAPTVRALNVTHGLIAVVTSLRSDGETFVETDQEWLHWIELDPIHPRQIYNCTAEWSAAGGVVNVQLTPKLHLPPGTEQKPLGMRCTLITDGESAPRAISRDYGLAPAFHFENLPPTATPRRILLDIDGYPRAFVMNLECPDAANRQATMVVNQFHVHFQSIRSDESDQAFFRAYTLTDGFQIADGTRSPDQVPSPLMKRPVFKGRAADDATPRLSTVLSVDVPNTFADRGQTRDAIVVSIDGATASTFRRERDTQITLQNASPAGILTMYAKVSDHVISFRPNRSNGEIPLAVNAQSDRDLEGQTHDTMTVLLDDTPPSITVELGKSIVTAGAPVIATVTALLAKNDAPLKFVEFGVDTNDNGKLDPGDSFQRRLEWPGKLKYELATQTMKPGTYTILARATDSVGQASATAQVSVRLVPPVAVTAPAPAPTGPAPVPVVPTPAAPAPVVRNPVPVAATVGIVRVQFTRNGRRLVRVVRLTATLNGKSMDAKSGTVQFDELPLGRTYNLRLQGVIQSDVVDHTFKVQARPASKATTILLNF